MSLEGGNLNDKSYKMLKSDNVSKQDKQQIRKALALVSSKFSVPLRV